MYRQDWGWSLSVPFSNKLTYRFMGKALSGALTLALIFVVLRLALPEVADLLTLILIKVLTFVNISLDQILSSHVT